MDKVQEAYARAFNITQAGIDSVRPGRTAADIFRAMAKELSSKGQPEDPPGPRGGTA